MVKLFLCQWYIWYSEGKSRCLCMALGMFDSCIQGKHNLIG